MHTPESIAPPEAVNTRERVRPTDRDTSQEAASKLTNGKLRHSQEIVYNLLVNLGPMTDDELRRELLAIVPKVSKSGPATRRHELELAGWVKPVLDDDGKTVKRLSDAGGPMTVWRAVPDADWTPPEPKAPKAAPRPGVDHEAGMAAARRLAGWEIGDPSWGPMIVGAYLNPENTMRMLDEDEASA